MKSKKRILITVMILLSVYFIFVEIFIYMNLKSYGYGLKELPKTTLVYFHLSNGFTVRTEENYTVFIGRHSYIYDDVLHEKGYYASEQMGMDHFYRIEGKEYSGDNVHEFCISDTNDWCHWFRVYHMSSKRKIEDL